MLCSRRRCGQRADHVRLVPESGREALFPEHGQRAEELLQREVLRRLPQGLLQEKQGRTFVFLSLALTSLTDFDTLLGTVDPGGRGGGAKTSTHSEMTPQP